MSILKNCWAGKFQAARNEYVACGAHAAFNFTPGVNRFSVQAWITSLMGPGDVMTVISHGFNPAFQYGVQVDGTSIKVGIGGELYSFDVNSLIGVEINNGAWHHVVVTWNLTSFKLYVNGQVVATQGFSGSTMYNSDLTIGGIRDTDLTDIADVYNGKLDEVGIWSKYLTGPEAIALYNGGFGLMLDTDSGSYESSNELEGWWRMGDGATEHAGGVPTATIYDESENWRHGTIHSDSLKLVEFYYGGDSEVYPVPGESYCILIISSSSVASALGHTFTISRSDQGNLKDKAGFEGDVHRTLLTCTSTEGIINKIFVHEMGRPYPGISLRKQVFRRVATLNDLSQVPEDVPESFFPFAFRMNQAAVYAPSQTLLNQAWREIQRQCATLSLDMQEFGAPVPLGGGAKAILCGGMGEADFVDSETFGAPEPWIPEPGAKSSSSSMPGPVFGSSSSSLFIKSSSGILVPGSSSSSWAGDAAAGSATYSLLHQRDAATRFHQAGSVTLFNDLGFIRFGRNSDPDEYWDAFLRFLIHIPKCAKILSARVLLSAHTSESGDDVVLRVRDIYQADGSSVGRFESSDDPGITRGNGIIWDQLQASSGGHSLLPTLDVTELLQYFVDRWNYQRHLDYFGLWIEEVVSDSGARRDAMIVPGASPYLQVDYRTDRGWCGSSSSWAG